MPFTAHMLEQIGEKGKQAKCTVCQQTWTSRSVRSSCPGVPVFPFEALPAHLKTLTALQRERNYPPDPDKADGAYRILKAPYYRLVYDERKAIHRPLSEKQLATIEKRKEAMRTKYTCRICNTFSTGRYERRDFHKGVCNKCQYAIGRYNEQIAWAQSLLENKTILLDIQTEPEVLPYSVQEGTPILISYTSMHLESGETLRQADMSTTEDLYYIRHLVCPMYSALVPYPWVLMLYGSELHTVRYELERNAKGLYLFNPNLTELLVTTHIEYTLEGNRPVSIYSWRDIAWNKGWTTRQTLEHICMLHGVDREGSTAKIMRRFVLHLAGLDMIHLDE